MTLLAIRMPCGLAALVLLLAAGSAAAQTDAPVNLFPPEAVPALVAPPPALPSVPASTEPVPLQDHWKYGLRFESEAKDISLFVGGRVQFDVANYLTTRSIRQSIPGAVPLDDGVSFRRVRLDMGGTFYQHVDYYAQVDFFNGFVADPSQNRFTNAAYPTDLWVTFKNLPAIGNVRVGNHKPPYSFEHLTSSRFLNFLERSLGFDAFVEGFSNGFAPGISAFDTYLDQRGTWTVGVFKTTRSPLGWNAGRNEVEWSGRITFLPVDEDGGRLLVHVGIGGFDRDPDEGQVRFRTRLDVRNSPSAFASLPADTGLFFASRQQLIAPELVVVCGPFSFQSEYYGSWAHGAATRSVDGAPLRPQGTVYLWSWYAEAHCFLTGEYRDYNREAGAFGRVVPLRPLTWSRSGFTGGGAWQVAARFSHLNLNSRDVRGGRVNDMTLGLNWFLNGNTKVQWNYFLADRDAPDSAGSGLIHGFGTRLAIDF